MVIGCLKWVIIGTLAHNSNFYSQGSWVCNRLLFARYFTHYHEQHAIKTVSYNAHVYTLQ